VVLTQKPKKSEMKNSLKQSNTPLSGGPVPTVPAVFKKADQEDIKAIQLLKKGDGRAFAHIMHKYHDVLLVKIENVVRDKDDAKDILQDIFVKVYSNLDRYEKRFTFNAWLTRVAINHTLDVLRKRKGKNKLKIVNETTFKQLYGDGENSSFEMSSVADDAAHKFDEESYEQEHARQYAKLEKLIKSLDEQDQAILTLFYLERKRQSAISSILGVPHVTIRVRINRIKKLMKRFQNIEVLKNTLDECDQVIVDLIYLEHKSNSDIARMVGMNPVIIKQRVSRLRFLVENFEDRENPVAAEVTAEEIV